MTAKADEQKTRKALTGSNSGMTYSRQAEIDQGLEQQGRFGASASVNGAEPAVHVPWQPANSPWAGDPVPPEEPLGFSVEDQLPTGTAAEIEASELAAASRLQHSPQSPMPFETVDAAAILQSAVQIEAVKIEELRSVLERLAVKLAVPVMKAGVAEGNEEPRSLASSSLVDGAELSLPLSPLLRSSLFYLPQPNFAGGKVCK
jgi:hypothetical protein